VWIWMKIVRLDGKRGCRRTYHTGFSLSSDFAADKILQSFKNLIKSLLGNLDIRWRGGTYFYILMYSLPASQLNISDMHELTETIQKITTYITRFSCKQIDPLHRLIRCLYVLCVESNCSIYSPTVKLFPGTIFAFRKIKSVFSEFKLNFCCQVWPTFKYHAWFCFYEINNFLRAPHGNFMKEYIC
jgi:hypothetical protein